MAIVSLCNAVKPSSTAEVTLYTAGSGSAVPITKFVAHNATDTASTYTVRIYGATGTPDSIHPVTVLNRYKSVTPAALAGAVIPPNGRLAVTVGVANTISFTVAGDV